MNLEDEMLSETCLPQKDKFHIQEVPRGVKSIKTQSRTWGPGVGGGGWGERI